MAESKEELSEDLDSSQFCCSVCLDQLKDPVAIPCGHSYCKVCIESFWDQNEEKGNCTCPQCRETFNPRPVLRRSNMSAQIVEVLERKDTQQTTPSLPEAAAADAEACTSPEDVPCDFCTETDPRKATMSCLACMASYCPVHIESHYSVPALKKHQLVSATAPLQEKMCTKHNKLMEKSTQTAVETSHKIFDELKLFFEQNCTSAEQLILAQEKTALAQAEDLQLRLEEEIAKLKKRDSELEQISHVDDHIHFIQTFQTLSASCESPDLPTGCVVRSKHTLKEVTDRLFKLKTDMKETWLSITSTMSAVKVLKHPEPKTMQQLLQYSRPLKLDERAVSQNLTLSEDHLWATSKMVQRCTNGTYITERITKTEQVWCCEALTERCYWEVSLVGLTWCVAVSNKDKNKTPSYNSEFGLENRSWSLECSNSGCYFRHNNQSTKVSDTSSSRVSVYLDYQEGILAFYRVCCMTLLHRIENVFTEPLYPCIGFKDVLPHKSKAYCAKLIKLWN